MTTPARLAARPWVAPAILVALGALVYANSLAVPFLFDDEFTVVANPNIRHLWPPWWLTRKPPQMLATRPLVSLTLALDYAVGGLAVRGYHVVNVALHVAAAVVLLGLLRRTFALIPRWRPAADALALAAAAIWVVHPLLTEAVTYVTQRTEIQAALFYLLTVYCAVRAWDGSRPAAWAVASVACCAIGMATKETMVSAPVVVALHDRVFRCGSWRAALARRWRLWAALAATWVILAVVLVVHPHDASIGFSSGITAWQYARTQCGVILRYLGLALWPAALCLDHGTWVSTTREAIPAVIVVVALLATTGWGLWRGSPLAFAGACVFLVLAPTSSIVPIVTEVMAERRMYLPLAALVAVAVVAGAQLLAGRPALRTALVVLIVVALGARTVARNRDYASDLTIWTDTVRKAPAAAHAHGNLGRALADHGRYDEAIAEYEEAIRLDPGYAIAEYNLGNALDARGRSVEAIAHYRRAVALDPGYVNAHVNLGVALAAADRLDEAMAQYTEALRLDPDSTSAHVDLGNALMRAERTAEALPHYAAAARLAPDLAEAHTGLADALVSQHRLAEAVDEYREALRLRPTLAAARANLAVVERALGGDGAR